MGTLSNLVYCGSSRTGRMIEYFDGMPKRVQEILKSVTQLQRRKFRRRDLVPVPVLEAMWHLGWLPGDRAPGQGMEILALTEYLRQGLYKSSQAAEIGHWLYETIVKEEMIGRSTFVKKAKFPSGYQIPIHL
jgi:hypothetical protein